MKKILLLFLCAQIYAQNLLQENFDNLGTPITLPSGWSNLNLSSPIGTVSWFNGSLSNFAPYEGAGYIAVNYQSGSGLSYLSNWLFLPSVTVQNGDEVSFYARASSQTWPDRLELRMSSLGEGSTAPSGSTGTGSYNTLCLTINPNLTTTGFPQTWTKYTYVVSGLTGPTSCKFALRYHVNDGGPNGNYSNYIGVDAVNIKRPVANDLALSNVTVPAIIPTGNFTFNGVVENNGNNNVTSYNVTWQANNGALNSHSVTGVNIAPGATHNFSHSIQLNAIAGQSYNFNFSISSVNNLTDGNTTNNNLSKSAQVATGSTNFKPLIEKFTSSTCGPCASYNGSTFNPYYAAQNQNFNYIAYQMNWPGSGDPYYTAEAGVRRGFYGVNAITSLWINGSEYSTTNNQIALTNHVNSESSKPGYFGLTANRDFTNNNAVVNYTITPYISGNFVLHTAVIETTTTNNFSTNGETSFKHVMMKMVPNASGTPLTLVAGTPISGQISASLSGTFIEESNDLEVVVFIQNPSTKEVMQSFKATDVLSVNENSLNSIKLYPNPTQDYFKLFNINDAEITITDTMGKIVMFVNKVNESEEINIASLNKGIYFVTIKTENQNQTLKLSKK